MKFLPGEKRTVLRTVKMPAGRDCIFFSFREGDVVERKENSGFLSGRKYFCNTLHSKVAANLPREFVNEDKTTV